MSWLAQVGHVFAKDVREGRWLLVAFLVLVTVAVGHSLGWRPLAGTVFGVTAVFVTFVAMLAVGSLVQQDSPTRSDAFWAGHPLRPSAVLGAKVMAASLMLMAGLVAHAIAMRAYDVHGTELLGELRDPALLFGGLLLLAMVAAALVRDLRSFLLALIAIPLLTAAAYGVLPVTASQVAATGRWAMTIVVLVVAGLLPWLYLRRDARVATRMLGFVAMGIALLFAATGGDDRQTNEAKSTGTVRTSVVIAPSQVSADRQIAVAVHHGPVPEGTRVEIAHAELLVHVRGDSIINLPVTVGTIGFTRMSAIPAPRDVRVRWLGERMTDTAGVTVGADMTPAQRRAVEAGTTGVTLAGQAVIVESRTIASLPLTVGFDTLIHGQRLSIVDWSHTGSETTLTIRANRLREVGRSAWTNFGWNDGLHYAIVNSRRREGVRLQGGSSSSNLDGLVLPGTSMWLVTSQLSISPPRSVPGRAAAPVADEPPSDEWYRDARLLVFADVPIAQFPVRVALPGPFVPAGTTSPLASPTMMTPRTVSVPTPR